MRGQSNAGRALLDVSRLAAIDMYGRHGSTRRRRLILVEFVLAAIDVPLLGLAMFLQTSIQHATLQQSRAGLLADQVIATTGAGLPAGVAQAARHVPGVASAAGIVRSTVFGDQGDEFTAEGVDAGALAGTLDLGTVSGNLDSLHGDTVAAYTVTANDLHLRVGSTFRGWFGPSASS
jgi:putative ABC transport system permease protein